MTVKYQVVEHCAECVDCVPDFDNLCYRCRRHDMEPRVDQWGELPDWCFLLTGKDVVDDRTDVAERRGLKREGKR